MSVLADDGVQKCIIRIDVPKSLFVHQSPGGYFERIGSSKRKMPPERLARLFQQRSQARMIYFDEQAVTHAPAACLEKSLWSKYTTIYSLEDEQEFLLKMKFLTEDQDGNIHPTVCGILMAYENPREYLAGAFIQAVAYRGEERNAADQFDAQDISGPLDRQIKDACAFVKKNMRVAAVKEPARRDIPQYSSQAVFEAVVNAVAHRDYSIAASKIRLHLFSNRLEIMSPGGVPNTLTIDTLPLRQVTRNELIATMLSRCTLKSGDIGANRHYFMERRGEGVPIILTESKKLSGHLPQYRLLDDSELSLTIYAAEANPLF
jgi:predicted HTH transcriptional regulator